MPNVLLLMRNLRKRVPREVAAEAFLLGGYIPNTALNLITLWPRIPLFPGPIPLLLSYDSFLLAASVAYLLTIILLLRGEAN